MDQKQIEEQGHEMVKVDLQEFVEKSKLVSVKVVGSIKTIFKHQKYIIQVYFNRKMIIRCFKRYNDFEALHELIKMKFQHQDLEDFPRKFQIFGKDQTRKQYFENFLTSLLKDHDSNRRLLTVVYLFLTKGIKCQTGSKLSIDSNQKKQQPLNKNNNQSGIKSQTLLTTPDEKKMEDDDTKRLHKGSYQQPKDMGIVDNKMKRLKRFSVDGEINSEYNMEYKKKNIGNQFEVRFAGEKQWRKRFLKIEGSSLLIYKDKMENNFRTKMELYRIKAEYLTRDRNFFQHFCQKMQFNVQFTFRQDPMILSLYHQYDAQKVLIRKNSTEKEEQEYMKRELDRLKNQIQSASEQLPHSGDFEGVFHPIGKLFIILNKIRMYWKNIEDQGETFVVRIKTSVFSYQSRKMLYKNEIIIRQGFLIPISNTFEEILIQCVVLKNDGWIREGQEEQIRGEYRVEMADLLTRPHAQVKLETDMETHQKDTITSITFSIDNFSHFSSIYGDSYANENDGKIQANIGKEDATQLIITIDRVLRIFGYVALFIQAFWRNVYLFKYPRMGYVFFSWLLLSAIVWDSNHTLSVAIIFLMGVVLYRHKSIGVCADEILNKYVFEKHPDFKHPLMLGKSEVSFLRWSNCLKYIGEDFELKRNGHHSSSKLEKKTDKKRLLFEFNRHGTIFQIRQEDQTFFEKIIEVKKILEIVHRMISAFVNTIEKMTSLLTWVDSRRTVFILVLLFLLSGVASTLLIRGIVCLFCIHRLVKGMEFYRSKHYQRNRHFAVYAMRYIIKKWYPQSLPIELDSKQITYEELDNGLKKIVLPIHDEKEQRRLKIECQEIVGVYFDVQGEAESHAKGTYNAGMLVDKIETCESRLKLKWIPGKQGISNQFQELKQITKQVPLIDVWVESLVINFLLNTPSKLYTTFYSQKTC